MLGNVGGMACEWMGRCDVVVRTMESFVDGVEMILVGLECS